MEERGVSSLIIPTFTAGSKSSRRGWRHPFGKAKNARWARVGGWTRRTSRSRVSGSTFIAPSTRTARPSASCSKKAALRFFKKAVRQHGLPDRVTIDKSGANTSAKQGTQGGNRSRDRESPDHKYLNNLVEQDHRSSKRIVRPMMGFKFFRSARVTLQIIELMHIIKKGQMVSGDSQALSVAGRFYSLAAEKPSRVV